MKKKIYKVLTVVLVIGLVVGCAGVVRHQVDLHKGAQDYADAEAIAGFSIPSGAVQEPEKAEQPEQDQEPEAPAEEALPAPVQALRGLDLEALQEVNGEAGGWLRIPGIAISYPLMFGGDNDYYLNHTWKKETSAVGSIFLDCRNNSDFQDFNTLVYGHRMRNESMFGLLAGYKDLEFWKRRPACTSWTSGGSPATTFSRPMRSVSWSGPTAWTSRPTRRRRTSSPLPWRARPLTRVWCPPPRTRF